MARVIISKLQAATTYAQRVGDTVKGVTVCGHQGGGFGFLAPTSTSMEVSDADAEFLANHKQFQQHEARGFVKIASCDPDNEP